MRHDFSKKKQGRSFLLGTIGADVNQVVAPITRTSLESLSRAVLPFQAAEVTELFLIAFVPEITPFVPGWRDSSNKPFVIYSRS